MRKTRLGFLAACALVVACSGAGEENTSVSKDAIIGPSAPGGRNEVVMIYAFVNTPTGSGYRTCSGTYYAPRVVVTAAHCLQDVVDRPLFVYYGDDFEADSSQLTEDAYGLVPPPPGTPSSFAQADSFESHSSFDPSAIYPDIGVVYLDRKLPFDPLPILRTPLEANRQVTLTGWGSNSTPTPTTGAGAGVQRTGTSRTLGSPTAADYHPEDPNPGLLIAANRPSLLKLDGRAPYANGCFGDSGGPVLVNNNGQTYIAGVNYFTGLSCADYSLATRPSSFLPFLDQGYKKGGQEVLKPAFDCVAPNVNGTLTAFFGYDNKNGVSVTVPYGVKNALSRDTTAQRLTRYLPGTHHFAFGVDFTASQTLSWTLSPDNSPTTTITVSQASRRCGAAEAEQTECALSCRASQRSGCAILPTFEECTRFCREQATAIRDALPQCSAANSAIHTCTAAVSSNPANWSCYDQFGAYAEGPCAAQIEALNTCFGF
ncbi:MAG: peptidase and chymotrypsin/Hap [Polyangiaceae bacterium]|jgi:hypothetical protein|nr:peptidase and chymotrypsin/Hap [Polyangiaceae bacterium]